jgi:hypothetical protein
VTGTYLWDSGHLHFVAGGYAYPADARVSSDGRRIAFMSHEELTSRDTGINPKFGTHWLALYVYDEVREALTCVSCPSSGAAMTGNVLLVPQAVSHGVTPVEPLRSHFLSSDGRFVFFSAVDALVPQDTNGLYDVYEYDTETGRVVLVSSGTGDAGAWFADASASGGDVFFLTRQSLTSGDTDSGIDLYDARVNGGLSQPVSASAPCVGDACQGAQGAPPGLVLPSGFSGPGNPVSKPAGSVVKRVKVKPKRHPVKKHKRKKRGKHGGKRGKGLGKRASLRAGR